MLVDNISQSTLPIYITYPYPFSFKVSRFCSLRNLDPILCRTKEPVPVSLPQWERQHKTEGCFAFAFIQITINALLLAALCSFFSHNFQLKKGSMLGNFGLINCKNASQDSFYQLSIKFAFYFYLGMYVLRYILNLKNLSCSKTGD